MHTHNGMMADTHEFRVEQRVRLKNERGKVGTIRRVNDSKKLVYIWWHGDDGQPQKPQRERGTLYELVRRLCLFGCAREARHSNRVVVVVA